MRALIYFTHPHAFIAPSSLRRRIPRVGRGCCPTVEMRCERPPAAASRAALPLCKGEIALAPLQTRQAALPLVSWKEFASLPLTEGESRRRRQGVAHTAFPQLSNSPVQGGVAARSRKFREATLASRRRGGWFNYRLIGGLNQPPRPLHQGGFAASFVMSRPPRLGPRRGIRLLRLDGTIKA